jgi:phenylalanine-4-hydroxylase
MPGIARLTQYPLPKAGDSDNYDSHLRAGTARIIGHASRSASMDLPQRVEHQMTDKGSVPVYTTAIVEQPWDSYSATDHRVWGTLFERQRELLPGRACEEFLQAQDAMGMAAAAIPKFSELNEVLKAATGWQLIGVQGLLPELAFFEHLAARRFPVTWWIRRPDQLDYIAEPDLFHDLFGHVPLLMNPMFADYMAAYGRGGVKAHGIGAEALAALTRLYWYTVEFGLIATPAGLRIYGSGIVSSTGESIHCLESPAPNRIGFDLERIMRTRYRIDTFQKTYFVIDGFEQLFEATRPDFVPLYRRLQALPSIPAGAVLDQDRVFQRGSGAGWLSDGDV